MNPKYVDSGLGSDFIVNYRNWLRLFTRKPLHKIEINCQVIWDPKRYRISIEAQQELLQNIKDWYGSLTPEQQKRFEHLYDNVTEDLETHENLFVESSSIH